MRGCILLSSYLQTRKNWPWIRRSRADLAAVIRGSCSGYWEDKDGSPELQQSWLWPLQGSAWKIGTIQSWREKRGSGALVDIQKHHLLQLKSSWKHLLKKQTKKNTTIAGTAAETLLTHYVKSYLPWLGQICGFYLKLACCNSNMAPETTAISLHHAQLQILRYFTALWWIHIIQMIHHYVHMEKVCNISSQWHFQNSIQQFPRVTNSY